MHYTSSGRFSVGSAVVTCRTMVSPNSVVLHVAVVGVRLRRPRAVVGLGLVLVLVVAAVVVVSGLGGLDTLSCGCWARL